MNLNGRFLALQGQWRNLFEFEKMRCLPIRVRHDEDLSARRSVCQARRQIDRVAHNRIITPVFRADLARDDWSAVDSNMKPELGPMSPIDSRDRVHHFQTRAQCS